jgi:uncharacterized iron-regulated membrane protein
MMKRQSNPTRRPSRPSPNGHQTAARSETSRTALRQLWLKVHRYIALTLGVWFVLLGLTGASNVFYTELEELSLPRLAAGDRTGTVSLDQVMATVKAAYPQHSGRWTMQLPGSGQDYLWVIYPNPAETADEFFAPLRVFVDPYTGRIVGRSYWGQTLWSLLYEFHADLLTGKIGPEIGEVGFNTVTLCGLLLLVSAVSGVYLWWPRQGKFRTGLLFKRNASPTRFNLDLHRISGFYGALFLIILAFTGFSFAYLDYIKPLVSIFSALDAPPFSDAPAPQSHPIPARQPITLDQAVTITRQIFPDGELRWLATPDNPTDTISVRVKQPGEANKKGGNSQVWIDQYNGAVLAISDPNHFSAGETFLNLMWPLHNGDVFGLPGRVIWCILGFLPLVLFVTGLRHWLAIRRAKKVVAGRQRSAGRDLHGQVG